MTNGRPSNIGKVIDKSPWWAPWMIVLVLVLGFVFNSLQANRISSNAEAGRVAIRSAVVESCERVNILREEVNERGEVLREFLITAASAREKTAGALPPNDPQRATNHETAARYRELAGSIDSVHVPNCEEQFPQQVNYSATDR